MRWFDVNIMKKKDLKVVYQFIRFLGPGGKPAPTYLPPDQEPTTPYALFPSPPKQEHQLRRGSMTRGVMLEADWGLRQ